MEDCVDPAYREEAKQLFHSKGFFASLDWMEGAEQALKEMKAAGFQVHICTSPIRGSKYCAQEKIDWITDHLGEEWLDDLIICYDKTIISGDLLIDDRPYDVLNPGGKHTRATWKQVIFDAPYNRQNKVPRINKWKNWRKIIIPMLGRLTPAKLLELSRGNDEFAEMIEETIPTDKRFADIGYEDEDDVFPMEEFQEKLRQIRTRSLSSSDGYIWDEANKENSVAIDTTNAAVQTSGKALEADTITAERQASTGLKGLKSYLPGFLQKNKQVN